MANETVIVGCKLPNGLILQVGDKRVCLRGSAIPKQPNAKNADSREFLYADSISLVDRVFWEAWVAQVGTDFRPLKSGAIYASNSKTDATSKAKETERLKTGFEGYQPRVDGLQEVSR